MESNVPARVKYAQSFQSGMSVERLFKQHFPLIFGHDCWEPSSDADINSHVDFYCIGDHDQIITFDVKGMKKVQRRDDAPSADLHWVEIQNVNGKPGWLHGQADYIVFEQPDTWLFTRRKHLIQLVERVQVPEYVYPPEPYKLYTRKKFGRDDICILLPTQEIAAISSKRKKPKE